MIRVCFLLFFFIIIHGESTCQSEDCNHLGVWLWHVETTGFSHEILSKNLANRKVKRIYVKVADGRVNTARWPELIDKDLTAQYKAEGLAVWAWSYNYPSNEAKQAEALYMAAETGYQGYVVDVEMEFDGNPAALEALFSAFFDARARAISNGVTDDSFQIYCTTWGNPKDHNYSIESIDPYVDGYMPQTYVEYWGQSYVDNITYWIEEGEKEYATLGATKPLHHIASTATGVMTSELIDEFIAASGPETSLWRIPGGGLPFTVWEDWNNANWEMDFCSGTEVKELAEHNGSLFYPNPTHSGIYLQQKGSFQIYDSSGQIIRRYDNNTGFWDLDFLAPGFYLIWSSYTQQLEKLIKY